MKPCKNCGEDESYHVTNTLQKRKVCRAKLTVFEPYKPLFADTTPIPADNPVQKPPPAHKEQVGGDHYKKMAIQPIEYIMANKLGYCEGNIVKYISRWRDKGGVEDLRKIKQYVDFLIERETK